ncbi:MAG: hypothetical protein V5B38_13800 [Candidatus Accumulibacter propinquus]
MTHIAPHHQPEKRAEDDRQLDAGGRRLGDQRQRGEQQQGRTRQHQGNVGIAGDGQQQHLAPVTGRMARLLGLQAGDQGFELLVGHGFAARQRVRDSGAGFKAMAGSIAGHSRRRQSQPGRRMPQRSLRRSATGID